MKATPKTREPKSPINPVFCHNLITSLVPRPLGASVELRHATGLEPELIRQREPLEGVCTVEFPYPKERVAGRGIVICGGGEKYLREHGAIFWPDYTRFAKGQTVWLASGHYCPFLPKGRFEPAGARPRHHAGALGHGDAAGI